jgi:RNA polymerase sigma-70 factor (ECF subfamily)
MSGDTVLLPRCTRFNPIVFCATVGTGSSVARLAAAGRFRSFLLTTLQNFLADEHDRAVAHKRGAGQPLISLDALDGEARYALEPTDDVSPDKLFERRWATTVLEQAWTRLESEYVAEGKTDCFANSDASTRRRKTLLATRKPPAIWACQRIRSNRSSTECGVVTSALLRAEIAHTVADPAEIDEEIRYLLRVLEG